MNQVEKIRSQYAKKEITELDKLKELDKNVKRPARIFAYAFGIIGSLILGTGMCFAMKVIGDFMILGIIIGLVGIAIVSVNYPIYKAILKSRKAIYGKEILELSDGILHDESKAD